jgi:hypothetical protein
MKFTYLEKTEITNIDILDNLDKNTIGIFLTEIYSADYWIEHKSNGYFQVSDGWHITKTMNFKKAQNVLEKFILENK